MPVEAPPAPAAAAPAPPAVPEMPARPGAPARAPMRGERVTKIAQGLEKMGTQPTPEPTPKPADKPAEAAPEPKPDSTDNKPGDAPQPKPAEEGVAKPTEAAPAIDKKDKPNPWKMYEQAKSENGTLKQRIHELETKGVNPQEKEQYLERIAEYEKKIRGYEDDLRYTNYSKSAEFKEKYQSRYDDRWKLAMGELGELTVPNPDGSERAFGTNDLLGLMNLPLKEAYAKAQELYGDLAGTVINHRTELRRIHDEMNHALEEAKTKASEREKQISEQRAIEQKQVDSLIASSFKASHEAAVKDPKNGRFFNQADGDDEWNTALQRGKELSAAFLQSPAAPGLSAEQRKEISEKHAAIFNRSAAFGPMKLLVTRLEKKVATLEKELSGFKQSSPAAATNGAPAPAPVAATGRKMDSMFADIAKRASQ
jgi:hypothetical protein